MKITPKVPTLQEIKDKVAVGYNRNQLARLTNSLGSTAPLPFLVFTDWLTYSVTLHCDQPVFAPCADWDFCKQDHNGRTFKNIIDVYYKNEKFAVLTYGGYGAISNFAGQLQLQNEWLYSDQQELRNCVFWLCHHIGMEINGISRLDIAIDFPEDSPYFPKASSLVTQLYSGEILLAGREKDLNIYSHVSKGGLQVTGLSLGKRSSAKFLRFYNKSLELESKPKIHIEKYHALLKTNKPVWRLEVQLNTAFWSQLKQDSKELALWGERYLNIMEVALNGFFSFHLNQGKGETNKNDSVDLIDWKSVHVEKPNQWYGVEKKPRNVVDDPIKKVQRAIKANFREYYKDQSNGLPLLTAGYYMNKYALFNWYELKIADWLFELDNKMKVLKTPFEIVQYQEDILKVVAIYPRIGVQYERIKSDYTVDNFNSEPVQFWEPLSPNFDEYLMMAENYDNFTHDAEQ